MYFFACCSYQLFTFLFGRYIGCVGGCDENLRELLDLKDLTRLPLESGISCIHSQIFLSTCNILNSPSTKHSHINLPPSGIGHLDKDLLLS